MKSSRHISVYLKDQVELDLLKAQAALKGLSLSNYMRKKAGLPDMEIGQGMTGINRYKRTIGASLEQPNEEKKVSQPFDSTPSHLEFPLDDEEKKLSPIVEVSTSVM